MKSVLVTGANGYIGGAVARAFVRAGWATYGLVRSSRSSAALAIREITPVIGSVDEPSSYASIERSLPPRLGAIVSTTESLFDYEPHFQNTIRFLRTLAAATVAAEGDRPLVIFTSGCKDYGASPLRAPPLLAAIPSAANAGLMSLHVDDCGDAYVAIASHEQAAQIDGEVFNIGPHRHETVGEVMRAVQAEYGLTGGVAYVRFEDWKPPRDYPWLAIMVGFPQWTDASKLRQVTGWRDRRPLFSAALGVYRRAFEAAVQQKDPMVARVKEQLQAISADETAQPWH